MPHKVGPKEDALTLRFGGGLHTRATEADIDARECSDGENFDLDLQNDSFRPRRPFDLVGTVPNAGEIRGFITLRESDGSTSLLVQAEDKVYELTYPSNTPTFTEKATVAATAQLRGTLQSQWQLDDEVLITDLNLADVVMVWDGTTLSDVVFTDEDGGAFGTFKARYCLVRDERAIFANTEDGVSATPHLIVGTKRSDYTNITVTNRPSSAIAEDDPFFLIQPDLRYINGLQPAFDVIATSSRDGALFYLAGDSAQDFSFKPLYPFSGVTGNEAIMNIGNDVIYGRQGIIESLVSTDKFGDTETDDLSADIKDQIDGYDDWTIAYNSRTQRVYCYSDGSHEIWVFYKPLAGAIAGEDQRALSPWIRYTTKHDMNMDPTCMMQVYDPLDGLEYIFFGDDSGNVYRMEGSTGDGDGGTEQVKANRLSKLFILPLDLEAYEFDCWISYRRREPITVTIKFYYQGYQIYREQVEIGLENVDAAYYGGAYYYGGPVYYSIPRFQYKREKFAVPGKSGTFQIEVETEDTADFEIQEIGIRFEATSS